MSDCDIPNKCPFCGEHMYCVNSRFVRGLPPMAAPEEIIEIDENGNVVSGQEQLDLLKKPGPEP